MRQFRMRGAMWCLAVAVPLDGIADSVVIPAALVPASERSDRVAICGVLGRGARLARPGSGSRILEELQQRAEPGSQEI
jgi:hypothetical protein